jgi:hypothetical protein
MSDFTEADVTVHQRNLFRYGGTMKGGDTWLVELDGRHYAVIATGSITTWPMTLVFQTDENGYNHRIDPVVSCAGWVHEFAIKCLAMEVNARDMQRWADEEIERIHAGDVEKFLADNS